MFANGEEGGEEVNEFYRIIGIIVFIGICLGIVSCLVYAVLCAVKGDKWAEGKE